MNDCDRNTQRAPRDLSDLYRGAGPGEAERLELGLAELQRSLVKLAERYWVLYDPIAGNAVYDTQTGDMTYYACAEEARKAAARLNEEGQK